MINPSLRDTKSGDRVVDTERRRTGELWNKVKYGRLYVTWHNENTEEWKYVKGRKSMLFQRH